MANLLLVEDQELMRQTLTTLLELDGHQIHVPEDETDIQQILKDQNIELALLDVHLLTEDGREYSGYEILDSIRRAPSGQDVKVVMISGMDGESQALEAGADAFLLKPYMPKDLQNIIKRLLSENREQK